MRMRHLPTFALIYVEPAGSPRVAKHTGPSEKRKHRRAAEDNRRRPPPSPGTAEIVRSPRHLPPPRLFSTPEMLSFPPSSMLAVFGGFPGNRGKASPAASFPKISSMRCTRARSARSTSPIVRSGHGLFLAKRHRGKQFKKLSSPFFCFTNN